MGKDQTMTDQKTDAHEVTVEEMLLHLEEEAIAKGRTFNRDLFTGAETTVAQLAEYKTIKANGGLSRLEAHQRLMVLLGEITMIGCTVTDPADAELIVDLLRETVDAVIHAGVTREVAAVLATLDAEKPYAAIAAAHGGSARRPGAPTFVEFCESNGETPEEIRGGCQLMRSLGIPEQDITGGDARYAPATDTAA